MPAKVDIASHNGRITDARIDNVRVQLEVISETLSINQPSHSESPSSKILEDFVGHPIAFDLLVSLKTGEKTYYMAMRKEVSRHSTQIYPLENALYNYMLDAAMAFNPIDFDKIEIRSEK